MRLAVSFLGVSALLAGCATVPEPPPPPAEPAFTPVIEYYHGMVARVPSALGCVALTFDDGPHAVWTPQLLRILAEEHVEATFFLVGAYAAARPDIVAAIAAGGHEIGNHSWSHPALPNLPSEQVLWQIRHTDEAIAAAAGVTPAFIRFPFGAHDARIVALMDRPVIFWSVDAGDWNHFTADQVLAAVNTHTYSGSIVGMHDTHDNTIHAIRAIIQSLRGRGYQLVTLSRLLSGQPCWDGHHTGT